MSAANESPGLNIPMFLQTDLYRLASASGIDMDDISSEDQCIDLIDNVIKVIERLQYDKKQLANNNDNYNYNSTKPRAESMNATKAKTLEDDIRLSLKSVEDLDMLRKKNSSLATKCRKEKLHREALEKFIETQNKKISILVEHIEKLMKAIKIESSKSMKALDDNRKVKKEKEFLNKKIEKLNKVTATQNRYIIEIAEGSRVLEDQLQLMDEKFLDMRSKMDMTRGLFNKEVDKVKKKCKELRLKYSVATGGGLLDGVDTTKFRYTDNNNNFDSFNGQMNTNSSSRPQSAMGRKSDPTGLKPRPGSAKVTSESGHDAANTFTQAFMRMEHNMWLSSEGNDSSQGIRRATITPLSRSSSAAAIRPSSAKRQPSGIPLKNSKDLTLNKVMDKIERKQTTHGTKFTDNQLKALVSK